MYFILDSNNYVIGYSTHEMPETKGVILDNYNSHILENFGKYRYDKDSKKLIADDYNVVHDAKSDYITHFRKRYDEKYRLGFTFYLDGELVTFMCTTLNIKLLEQEYNLYTQGVEHTGTFELSTEGRGKVYVDIPNMYISDIRKLHSLHESSLINNYYKNVIFKIENANTLEELDNIIW